MRNKIYSKEIKDQVIDLVKNSPLKITEIAKKYEVSRKSVYKWAQNGSFSIQRIKKNRKNLFLSLENVVYTDFKIKCLKNNLKSNNIISELINQWTYGNIIQPHS
jgi:transposase-like protein